MGAKSHPGDGVPVRHRANSAAMPAAMPAATSVGEGWVVGRSKRVVPRTDVDKQRVPKRRATKIATEGRVALVEGPANSRLFVCLVGNYIHRIDQVRRAVYFGDLDLALVGEVIGAAGMEPGLRDAAFREKHKYFDKIVGTEELRSINSSSIATATGIPRETVRRRIKRLLKLGFIVEKEPARYVMTPGIMLDPRRQAAYALGIDQTVQFINELLESGMVRWVPARRTRSAARK